MSATGRGTIRDERDFYPTPWGAAMPMIRRLPINNEAFGDGSHKICFHDPCAGDGRLLGYIRETGRLATGSDLFPQKGSVIDRRYYDETPVDYLKDATPRLFTLTNPPFSVAFEMCQHSLRYSRETLFLLRLSFLESEERGEWFERHEPNGLWVLKKRPSFAMSITCKTQLAADKCLHNWMLPIESERPKVCPKCGGTKLAISTSDNSGYAWYYWGPRAELSGIHHI